MVILEEWLHSPYVFISIERADSQGRRRRLFRGCLDGQSPVHRTLRDHSVYPVQFVLKELIWDTVTECLPRKSIAPDFDLADLLVREAVDPATLGDESADQAIVMLYGSLFTTK